MAPEERILDGVAVLARVGNDRELLKELVDLFLEECPGLVDRIRAGIVQQDASKLKSAAHTLKGAVSNFSTWPAFELALRLETMGQRGDFSHALEALAALEEALASLRSALLQLVSAGGSP
jgi:HPt (histidine-containing phosphotransfer) domain-containing protein